MVVWSKPCSLPVNPAQQWWSDQIPADSNCRKQSLEFSREATTGHRPPAACPAVSTDHYNTWCLECSSGPPSYLRLQGDTFLLDLGQLVGDLLLGLNLTLQVGLQVEQLHLVQALGPPVAPPRPILEKTHRHRQASYSNIKTAQIQTVGDQGCMKTAYWGR